MPQILVEFAVDTNLFRLLYNKPLDDLQFDKTDNPDQCMLVHSPCIPIVLPMTLL